MIDLLTAIPFIFIGVKYLMIIRLFKTLKIYYDYLRYKR